MLLTALMKLKLLAKISVLVWGLFFLHYLLSVGLLYTAENWPPLTPLLYKTLLEPAHPFPPSYGSSVWDLNRNFHTWDTHYYLEIAERGYSKLPFNPSLPQNWAFYPFYPLLISAAVHATATQNIGIASLVAAIFISNSALIFALYLIKITAKKYGISRSQVNWAVFWLLFFPASHALFLGFTESVFLCTLMLYFWALSTQRFTLAAWCVAVASCTKVTGVLLLPVLLIAWWQLAGKRLQLRAQLSTAVALSILSLLPLWLFYTHLHTLTGNFFASFAIQEAWNNAGFIPFQVFSGYYREYGFTIYPPHVLSLVLLILLWGVTLYWSVTRLKNFFTQNTPLQNSEVWWFLYTVTSLVVISSVHNRSSIFRYVLVIPIFFLIASNLFPFLNTRKGAYLFSTLLIFFHILFFSYYVIQVPAYGF